MWSSSSLGGGRSTRARLGPLLLRSLYRSGRDIPAGESLDQTVVLAAPSVPGRYELSIGVRQVGTTAFDGPDNQPLRIGALVAPPSSSAGP